MKYLLTGAAGFIGSNLAHLIMSKDPTAKICVIDKLGVGSDTNNLEGLDVQFEKCDLTDYESTAKIVNDFKPDYLIHLAAESHVDRSILGSHEFVKSNVIGTHSVLEALLSLGTNIRALYVSTDEVYGSLELEDKAFTEKLKHEPSSVYSATKSAGEALVHAYIKTYKLDIVITNCSNNYGPRQYEEKLIPKVIKSLLFGDEIGVYGNGSNIRDWIHVDDHNEALLKVLIGGMTGENYNVGSNNEVTNLQLIEKITAIIESQDMKYYMSDKYDHTVPGRRIRFVQDRKGHDFRYAIDSSKIHQNFNWKPAKNFEESLVDTVKWYIDKFLTKAQV